MAKIEKPDRKAAVEAKAKKMVANLRRYWEAGKQYGKVRKRSPERKLLLESVMDRYALSEDSLRKAKVFWKKYSEEELNELCSLRRENGLAIHTGYIPYLLSVKDKDERNEFLRQVVANNWSAPQLRQAIRNEGKRGEGHGRKMAIPASPEAALQQVVNEGNFLKRRCDAVLAKLKEDKLTRRFEERLGAIEAAAVQLSEAAEKLQTALRTLAASGKKAQASRKQAGKAKPKRG